MADGSDAIADWPLLNALVNTASGATWVSIHHGGGVGIGRSIHAGQVSVADGTALAAEKLARVLTNDPAMGVLRHVDAGYPEAEQAAEAGGLRVPMAECQARRVPRPTWIAAAGDGRHATARRFDRHVGRPGRRSGGIRHRRLPAVRLDPRGRRPAGVVRRRGRRAAGSTSSTTGPATCGPGGAIPTRDRRTPGRRPRLAPGLRARRRRLRRPARRRLAPSPRVDAAAGARVHPGPAARRRRASPTRRAPGSASPAPGRGCSPARWPPTGPAG